MASRLDLQYKLEEILRSQNVYFQPPATVKMKYPAIVYQRDDYYELFADNTTYHSKTCYTLTLIGASPESPLIEEIHKLPMCRYTRFYTADNLNHDQFRLYW